MTINEPWLLRCLFATIVGAGCGDGEFQGGPDGHAELSKQVNAITLWTAGVETGNLSEWYSNEGGGEYNGTSGCNGDDIFTTCSVASDGSSSQASTEQAHTGAYSAKLSIPGTGAVRLNRALESRNHDDLVYTVWYYFPRRYTRDIDAGGWTNIMQWKSVVGEENVPLWILSWDNTGANGAMRMDLTWWYEALEGPRQGQSGRQYWEASADIPVGRWFKVEARYKKASDFSGAVQVWQDGVLVLDVQDVRSNFVNGELAWYTTNYAESIAPSPYSIYVDDLSVSTGRLGGNSRTPAAPTRLVVR